MITLILQIIATTCFALLGLFELLAKRWDFAGLNFALVLLYIFLYFQPFTKLLGK